VQALYEWDTSGHDAIEAATHRLEDDPAPERVRTLALSLVGGVREHQGEVDAVLSQAAPQWRVEEMAVVDRNILRVAIYEVLFDNKTPVRAAVNEAVELAKTFGGESSPRFVNGVLGAVASMSSR
jgi:N utilization substance protein B